MRHPVGTVCYIVRSDDAQYIGRVCTVIAHDPGWYLDHVIRIVGLPYTYECTADRLQPIGRLGELEQLDTPLQLPEEAFR